MCCQQKTTGSVISWPPFVASIRDVFVLFHTNEKILMGKYKRRKANVVWEKEDSSFPFPAPLNIVPIFSPRPPHLSYFLLTGLENVTGLFDCVTLQLNHVKFFHRLSQNSFIHRQRLSDRVWFMTFANFCMSLCDIGGTFRFPW